MDKQLDSPLLIQPIGQPRKLGAIETYTQLTSFLQSLPAFSPARTQLERLTDALGIETGQISPSVGEAREAKRIAQKAEKKAERRRQREAAQQADLEAEVEGLEGVGGDDEKDGEMEEGAVGFDGEEGMDDKGDVEYGDVEDSDQDEPDNEKMETDD